VLSDYLSQSNDTDQLQILDLLLSSLYGCVNSDSGFKQFLYSLNEHLSVFSAALCCIDPARRKGYFGWSTGYPPGHVNGLIKTGLIFNDEAVLRASRASSGSIYSFSEGRDDFDIFNQLSLTSKIWAKIVNMKDSACFTFNLDDGRKMALIINRNKQQGVFAKADLQLLNRLASHIERAVSLYITLHHQLQLKQGLDSAINSIDHAMAVYSATGLLINTNKAFINFGEKHQIYQANASKLIFSNKHVDEQFQQLISLFMVAGDDGVKITKTEVMYIKNNENSLLRFHLRALFNDHDQLTGVLVEAKNTLTSIEPTVDLVCKIINCSNAEAKVVLRLLAGEDAATAAKSLCLSPHTVRSYIKEVLSKNDFKRQIDLISVLLKALG
jgi:DNA-binding CsgD family transcriptional regulator